MAGGVSHHIRLATAHLRQKTGARGEPQTLLYLMHASLTCCCGWYQQCMSSQMWTGTADVTRQSPHPTAVLHVHERATGISSQQPCSPAYACLQALPHLPTCQVLQHGQQQDYSLLLLQVLLLLLQLSGMTLPHCCARKAWQHRVRCQRCFESCCMPGLQTLQRDGLRKANCCWYLQHWLFHRAASCCMVIGAL